MTDLFQKLNSKKVSFNDIQNQVQVTLTRLKQQNDQLQLNCDLELDNQLIKGISKQREQMKLYISQSRELLQEMEKQAKGFDQRKMVKKMKQVFSKEVERNRQIMNVFIKKSFGSFGDTEEETREDIQSQMNSVFPEFSEKLTENEPKHQVLDFKQLKHEYYIADFENQMIKEKQQDINQIEHDAINLNKIMGQLATTVDEQDQQLDIITEQLLSTKSNMEKTNKELQITDKMSRQGKKKYIVFALIVLIFTSALITTLFYTF